MIIIGYVQEPNGAVGHPPCRVLRIEGSRYDLIQLIKTLAEAFNRDTANHPARSWESAGALDMATSRLLKADVPNARTFADAKYSHGECGDFIRVAVREKF